MRPQASQARTSPPRDDVGTTARLHCSILGKYLLEYIIGTLSGTDRRLLSGAVFLQLKTISQNSVNPSYVVRALVGSSVDRSLRPYPYS